jgi:surfeit locus 1 family protein
VAPYFIDADAQSAAAGAVPGAVKPVGGLTVVSFQNNHLVYAITWYVLALMVAGAFVWVWRDERLLRRDGQDSAQDGGQGRAP